LQTKDINFLTNQIASNPQLLNVLALLSFETKNISLLKQAISINHKSPLSLALCLVHLFEH